MNITLLRIIFLTALTIQNTSLSLLTRYSRGVLKEQYLTITLIMLSEIVKCLISLVGVFVTRKDVNFTSHIVFLMKNSLVSSVPALIYFIQNILYQVSLSHIQPGLYSVLSQVKILSAAILSVLILGKKLTMTQWRALCLLVMSVIIVEGASRTSESGDATSLSNYIIGVSAALFAATASGFSGVYMEKILKNKVSEGPKLNLWERNFQLSIYSIAFSIINTLVFSPKSIFQSGSIFQHFTFSAFLLVLIMSIGGILVALVMTYADVIVKGFAASIAIVCTSTLSYFIFGTPISLEFAMGAVGVIISIANYNDENAKWATQHPNGDVLPNTEMKDNSVQETETSTLIHPNSSNIDVINFDELDVPSNEPSVLVNELEN